MNENEILVLKNLLEQTDNIPNKIIEGLIDTLREATPVTLLADLAAYVKSVSAEYGDTIRQRAEWRKKINELEEVNDMEKVL